MRAFPASAVALAALFAGLAVFAFAPRGPRGRDTAAGEAPALTTASAAWSAAWPALVEGSWDALVPVLTERGRAQVAADLAAWRDALASPSVGPRTIARLPAARDESERKVLERALAGDTGSLLRVLRGASPLSRGSAAPEPRLSPDRTYAQVEYAGADGAIRSVVLVATPAGWRVDRLPL